MKPIYFRHTLTILFVTLFSTNINAQALRHEDDNIVWPERDTTSKFYTVSGTRHGISYFPKVRYNHVEYTPTERLSFDKFHSADVVYHWMTKWANEYPDIVDLYIVDNSYEGRPIYQMTVTNKKSGKATDKPAAFFEGNRHSGEVTSTESVLWLMHYLIENYNKESDVTQAVDNYAIHLRPINNPDGHNLYMHTAQSNRSTVRPFDNDGDGLLDEDPSEDLDGDGYIRQMRYKVEAQGDYIIDPRDATGRLMKRVEAGKGDYKIAQEGIDNDGDGRINEDGIGGLDLHRNYPENWRPARENTGRGWTQGGAGEYPLSEIETRSVFLFLLANPNIYIVNSMDTRVPMHLRAPSTAPASTMFPEDNFWYEHFDKIGKSITGYTRAGDVYNDYGRGNPLFGHGPDFGYWYYGAIWYGDELWDGGVITKDYNEDGVIDDLDKLLWNDQDNEISLFQNWTPYTHPTLGEVEIGGWNPKFYSQNAPSNQVERWAKNQALFNFEMVKHLPQIDWEKIEVKKVKNYKRDSTDWELRVSYKNTGKLPTALKQAHQVKIVREDMVTVSFPQEFFNNENPKIKFLEQSGRGSGRGPASSNRVTKAAGYAQGESTNTVVIKIRTFGNEPLTGKAVVTTTRAGILEEREFTIQ